MKLQENDLVKREESVLLLKEAGYSYNEIAKRLGMTKSLVAYYVRKNSNKIAVDINRENETKQKEYEEVVCQEVKNATSMCELCRLMNKKPTNNNYLHFQRIIEKYNLDTSHFSSISRAKTLPKRLSLEEKLTIREDIITNGNSLKKDLLKYGLKEYRCEKCRLTEWNGEAIPLQLHHINGNRCDNRLENLQLLCPNCHTQTDNYAGRNIDTNKLKKKYICKCCGKEFYIGEGSTKSSRDYCSVECRDKMAGSRNQYVQKRFKEEKEQILKPNKETLYNDFKELGSFVKIGEKYRVSDNAVKKWFKKHGLPIHSKDMRKEIISKFGKQPQWFSKK